MKENGESTRLGDHKESTDDREECQRTEMALRSFFAILAVPTMNRALNEKYVGAPSPVKMQLEIKAPIAQHRTSCPIRGSLRSQAARTSAVGNETPDHMSG